MTAGYLFEELVKQYSDEIYRYLWRMLRDSQDAEDCLQEVFIRAFRASSRISSIVNPRAWLYKIASNTAMTSIKRRQKLLARTADLHTESISVGSSVTSNLELTENFLMVEQAIAALPQRQQTALILRKYQELSYEEIANVLDCSATTARAHVYQGLKKLRSRFHKEPLGKDRS
jgi:RNA polymerase sigma-70 factor, ECF subfamily